MSAFLYPVNMFRINSSVIPDWIYKYKLKTFFESDGEYYRKISGMGGVDLEKNERIFITLIEQSNNEDVEFIGRFKFEESNLDIVKREQLVSKYLRWERNIQVILNKSVKKLRKELKVGKFLIKPYVKTEVKLIDGNFYLIVNFSHSVTSAVNLWDYVGRDGGKLKEYKGKRLKFLLNPQNSYTIKEVGDPDPIKVDEIIEYALKKGLINSKAELETGYGKIDFNQPIIYCEEISYPFLPQLSALVFNMEEVEGTEEASELQKYWRFSNAERLDIISKIVKSLSDIIDPKPILFEFNKLKQSHLLVRGRGGEDIKISKTSYILSWLVNKNKTPIYLPYEVPAYLKGVKIPTFILIDNEISDIRAVKELVIDLFKRYNAILNQIEHELPYFNFAGKIYEFERTSLHNIVGKIRNEFNLQERKVGFALIVGKEVYSEDDYYEDLKRQLFQLRIISQNVIWNTLKGDERGYVKNNLLIQIMGKMGIKYFALDRKTKYDYILGVDVGRGIYGKHKIGGCAVIFDSEGKVRKIVPVKVDAPGETLDLSRIIEYLQNKAMLEFENRNVLLLRDGKIQYKEKEDLIYLSRNLKTHITFINIKKNHNYKIGADEYGLAISFGDLGLLLPHTTPWGSNPLKIDNKLYFEKGNLKALPITLEDLQLLYDLTKLNYSNLFNEKLSLRLPAPVHYADRFIKAVGKDWEIDEDLLREGCLYFI